MSTYYYYRCETCNEDSDSRMKYGDKRLVDAYRDYGLVSRLGLREIKLCMEWDADNWCIWFLEGHYGHSVVVMSEYGDKIELG